jgi:hypothetical protein
MTKLLGGLALAAMSVALTLPFALSTHVASVSASSERSGDIHLEKNCSDYFAAGAPAGGDCTFIYSNVPQIIPVGSRIFVDQAFGIPNIPAQAPATSPTPLLDSNVLLYVKSGDWAVGRCTLDSTTNAGLCNFWDGVGSLTGFHARIDVSLAPGIANYDYNGTYTVGPEDKDK